MIYTLAPWDWEEQIKNAKNDPLRNFKKNILLVCADPYLMDLLLKNFLLKEFQNCTFLNTTDVTVSWVDQKIQEKTQLSLFMEQATYILPFSSKYPKDFYLLTGDFFILTSESIPNNASKDFSSWEIWTTPEITPSLAKKFFFQLAKWKNISLDFSRFEGWKFLEKFPFESAYELSQLLDETLQEDFQIPKFLTLDKDKQLAIAFWDKNFKFVFKQISLIIDESKLNSESSETIRGLLNEIKFVGLNRWNENKLPKWNHQNFVKTMMQLGNWEMDLRNSNAKVHWSKASLRLSFLKTNIFLMCLIICYDCLVLKALEAQPKKHKGDNEIMTCGLETCLDKNGELKYYCLVEKENKELNCVKVKNNFYSKERPLDVNKEEDENWLRSRFSSTFGNDGFFLRSYYGLGAVGCEFRGEGDILFTLYEVKQGKIEKKTKLFALTSFSPEGEVKFLTYLNETFFAVIRNKDGELYLIVNYIGNALKISQTQTTKIFVAPKQDVYKLSDFYGIENLGTLIKHFGSDKYMYFLDYNGEFSRISYKGNCRKEIVLNFFPFAKMLKAQQNYDLLPLFHVNLEKKHIMLALKQKDHVQLSPFYWNTFTHPFYPQKIKERIETFLLCSRSKLSDEIVERICNEIVWEDLELSK